MFKFWKYSGFTLSLKHVDSICNVLFCQGTVRRVSMQNSQKPGTSSYIPAVVFVPSPALWWGLSPVVLLSCSSPSLHPCPIIMTFWNDHMSLFWIKMTSEEFLWFRFLYHLTLYNLAYTFLLRPSQKEASLCVLGGSHMAQSWEHGLDWANLNWNLLLPSCVTLDEFLKFSKPQLFLPVRW